MSVPTVSEIASALAAAIGTIEGLRVVEYLADTISPPVAVIGIDSVDYHGSFGSSDVDVEHTFTVFVILARSSDRAAFALLEGYMSQAGASSVRAAIEADTSLGGVVSTLIVTKSGPPAGLSINGAEYISVPFTVEVHA